MDALEQVRDAAWETSNHLVSFGGINAEIGQAFAVFARMIDAIVETEAATLAALGDPREGEF